MPVRYAHHHISWMAVLSNQWMNLSGHNPIRSDRISEFHCSTANLSISVLECMCTRVQVHVYGHSTRTRVWQCQIPIPNLLTSKRVRRVSREQQKQRKKERTQSLSRKDNQKRRRKLSSHFNTAHNNESRNNCVRRRRLGFSRRIVKRFEVPRPDSIPVGRRHLKLWSQQHERILVRSNAHKIRSNGVAIVI